ncbi:MAG: phosphoglycerate dehydrogenase [Candidatus Marinimicrobia bacterium]|nr:phosphoglycerate dehydrogenase [Candidatus Neomarinimicrobiota bacterium]
MNNDKQKILLLENIHVDAEKYLIDKGFEVEIFPHSLNENELIEKIKGVSLIGIRSKTKITEKVLNHADKLIGIGAFCIGTNQINISACNKKGVAVFNAPYSNTRSVVELVIGNIISLIRKSFDRSLELHNGKWSKTATGSFEIRGKNLGIIGYGNIGSQLSVLAESLGMNVYYFDTEDKLPMGNVKNCKTMNELLKISDFITIHVDGRESNTNLISEKEFKVMKDGAYFLNLSRGFVVNLDSLAENIRNGKIAGASVDVYPNEPKSNKEKFNNILQNLPNTILTPHIGGSTEEAQKNIAQFVSSKFNDFLTTGSTISSVNFPNLQLPAIQNAHRFIHLHQNIPGMLSKLNQILAENNINIESQFLKTNKEIGYVIFDIHKDYDKNIIEKIRSISGSISLRILS